MNAEVQQEISQCLFTALSNLSAFAPMPLIYDWCCERGMHAALLFTQVRLKINLCEIFPGILKPTNLEFSTSGEAELVICRRLEVMFGNRFHPDKTTQIQLPQVTTVQLSINPGKTKQKDQRVLHS